MKEQFNNALENLVTKLEGWFNTIIEYIPNFILAILVMVASYFAARYISKLVSWYLKK